MIGAILLKLMAGSGMEDWNRRNVSKILSHYTKDGTYTYPGHMSVSGTYEGKEAIEAFFNKYLEQFPKLDFKVKTTMVKNIFDPFFCNTLAVEFECTVTNRNGEVFENGGVGVTQVKWGKLVSIRDYYFDTDKLQRAWGEEIAH